MVYGAYDIDPDTNLPVTGWINSGKICMEFCEMCWDDIESNYEMSTKIRSVLFEIPERIQNLVEIKYPNGLPITTNDIEISFIEKNGTVHTYEAESWQSYTPDGYDYMPIHFGIEPFYTAGGSGRYSSIDDIVI